MEARYVIALITAVLSASIVMFLAMWRYVANRKEVAKEDYDKHVGDFNRHKDKVVYKENCIPRVKGIKAEIAAISNVVKIQFENMDKLEGQKMEFYKKQIDQLSKNDEALMKKMDTLLQK